MVENAKTIKEVYDGDPTAGADQTINYLIPADNDNTPLALTAVQLANVIDYRSVAIAALTSQIAALTSTINILNYGGDNTGSTFNDGALVLAIAAANNNSAAIYFPTGSYRFQNAHTINIAGITLVGDGNGATQFNIEPTGNLDFLTFKDSGAGVYFRGGVIGIKFYTPDTTYVKTGIIVEDTSGITLIDVKFASWSDATFESVAIQTKGREQLKASRLELDADLPIRISQNPNVARNTVLDADHFHFEDCALLCTVGTSYGCVEVDDGVNVANMVFDGYQAWVRPGGNAFNWDDTSSIVNSFQLTFENVRVEQTQNPTAYSFFISHNSNLTNPIFNGVYCDPGMNSFYLRKVQRPTLFGSQSPTTGVALDADATCDDIQWTNVQWQASSTISIGTLLLMESSKRVATGSPLPETGHLVTPAANTWQQQALGIFDAELYQEKITLANGAFYDLPISAAQGVVCGTIEFSAYEGTPTIAYGLLNYNPQGPVIISASGNVSTTLGTPASFNVGHQGGVIARLENNLGVTMTVYVRAGYIF